MLTTIHNQETNKHHEMVEFSMSREPQILHFATKTAKDTYSTGTGTGTDTKSSRQSALSLLLLLFPSLSRFLFDTHLPSPSCVPSLLVTSHVSSLSLTGIS